eukprot:3610216-Rhodomonas_salina.1
MCDSGTAWDAAASPRAPPVTAGLGLSGVLKAVTSIVAGRTRSSREPGTCYKNQQGKQYKLRDSDISLLLYCMEQKLLIGTNMCSTEISTGSHGRDTPTDSDESGRPGAEGCQQQ